MDDKCDKCSHEFLTDEPYYTISMHSIDENGLETLEERLEKYCAECWHVRVVLNTK